LQLDTNRQIKNRKLYPRAASLAFRQFTSSKRP